MATNNAINRKAPQFTIDSTASEDAYVQFSINGTGEFRIGVDDTDDSFRISQGSALGTNDTTVVSSAGEVTHPLQPAFLASVDTTITNVTGDGTVYTIVFDNEIFDQNSDFDGTSTFTAPVTGRYYLYGIVKSGDLSASFTAGRILITTSNHTMRLRERGAAIRDASDEFSQNASVLSEMDAADTAVLQIFWSGGSKVVDVEGDASNRVTIFGGYLGC